jgi:hypothetical protein
MNLRDHLRPKWKCVPIWSSSAKKNQIRNNKKMSEFQKLKQRLRNIGKNTTEYRMTVEEAKNLMVEFETISAKQEKPQTEVVLNEPTVIITRTLDGGAL